MIVFKFYLLKYNLFNTNSDLEFMNSLVIKSLRQKFERRVNDVRNSDFASLQASLRYLFLFFDSESTFQKIHEDLMKQIPNLIEKVNQIYNAPHSNIKRGASEIEAAGIASKILFDVSKADTNKYRGKLQASVGSNLFEYQNLSQGQIDDNFTKAFKDTYLNKFYNYIDEQLEELEFQSNASIISNEKRNELNLDSSNFWHLLHPEIAKVSQTLFETNHFAESIVAAFKEVNVVVKTRVKNVSGIELDGTKLMQKTFSTENPILLLGDIDTLTGKDLQQGYQQIFTGSILGIRNPNSHENSIIDENRAIHLLFLASLLMHKIDEAKLPKAQTQKSVASDKAGTPDSSPNKNTKSDLSIHFENKEPFIKTKFYGDAEVVKKIGVLVVNESEKTAGLEALVVLDSNPLEDIRLLPKGSPDSTFILRRGSRQFIDIAEYRSDNKMVRFNALPSNLEQSVITLEENQKITFTIKINGDLKPCSKRLSFCSKLKDLQIEEI